MENKETERTKKLVIGLVFLIACLGVSMKFSMPTWAGILPGAIGMTLAFFEPRIREEIRKAKIEREIPELLWMMASRMESGISMMKTLRDFSNRETPLASEIREILIGFDNGEPFPIAVGKCVKKINTKQFKKFSNQLVLAYKSGGDPENLKKLAKDIRNKQKLEIKKFSGKVVMYSLILVSVSSILPALFQAYSVIGSLFLKIDMDPGTALAIPTILFPSINLAIMMVIQWKKPRFMW